jgi:protein TonB
MFTQLVESKPATRRGRVSAVLSFVAHYGLVLVVLYTSADARIVNEGPKPEKIVFTQQKVEEQPKQAPPPEIVVAPTPMKTSPLIVAPIEIPNALPEIDLTHAPTDPSQFTGGKRGPVVEAGPDRSAQPVARPENALFEYEVEKPVSQAPNSAVPVYPDILRQAGVEGTAIVSFVVDTTGRVDLATFTVIHKTHDLFVAAVRNALPRMRFIPAETSRGKVRQFVQQPFSFTIVK